MGYEEIVYESRRDAAWIGINRPEASNSFPEETLGEYRSDFKPGNKQCEAPQGARP